MMKVHDCGGTILAAGSGEERHAYCMRCGAYRYGRDVASLPTGTDPVANRAAWDAGADASPDAIEPRRYGYIIYDADPASGVNPWPSHAGATLEADSDDDAVECVRDALDVCAAVCDSADGYEAGDVLHAIVWDTDGRIVGTLRRVLTAEDLGEED